jgi:hypothetical protein
MACAIHQLRGIQESGAGDLSRVRGQLHKQQAASRSVGCTPISHLCQTLEDCLVLEGFLATGRDGNQPAAATVVAVLLDGCRTIRLHAEAVNKTAIYLNQHEGSTAFSPRARRCLSGRLLD